MREKTIRKLVKLVEEAEIESLTIQNWWTKVQITKRGGHSGNGGNHGTTITVPKGSVKSTLPPLEQPSPVPIVEAISAQPQPVNAPAEPKVSTSAKEIKSPMVGTFYAASEPGAPPFVEVGQRVKKGQTICLIEAMKLMNEIEAEFDGVITQRMVENANPVEFGQTLFVIEPA